MAEVRRSFVPMIGNDVAYREHPEKDRGEYRLLAQIFRDAPEGIHQGIFAATSSGRLLARVNQGWPAPDPAGSLRVLRQALAAYRQLPAAARVAARDLDPKQDRILFPTQTLRPPPGALDLRVTRRSYPFSGMELFDRRHPDYLSLDRVLFRPEEARELVPTAGNARAKVTGAVLQRLITHGLMVTNEVPWEMGAVRRAELTLVVAGQQGKDLQLRLAGEFDLRADTQWNRDSYQGDLLGRATWDGSRFTRFEMVSLSRHHVGEMRSNMHRGSPDSAVAALITLFPAETDMTQVPLPPQWRWGYPNGFWR